MTAQSKSKARVARNAAGGLLALLFLAGGFVFIATRTRATSGTDEQERARAAFTVEGVLETDEVDVSSKIPGRIKEMLVSEGDAVEAGRLLAVIEAQEIDAKYEQAEAGVKASQAQLDQGRIAVNLERSKALAQVEQARAGVAAADAALAMAQSKLRALENGARPQERAMADQALAAAKAQFDTAQKTWGRVSSLAAEGVIAQQRADEAEMMYLSARAQYEGARAKVDMVYEGARPEEVQAARDQVRQAQAGAQAARQTLNMAEAALLMVDIRGKDVEAAGHKVEASKGQLNEVQAYRDQTRIVSPIAGRVSRRMARAGEMAAPGYALLSVTRTGGFWVDVFVDEDRFAGRGPGTLVTVSVPATGQTYRGVVSQILPAASFATKRATNENGSADVRSLQVRVSLKDGPENLASGLTARVTFPDAKKDR